MPDRFDVIHGLAQLGYTEYEAKAYLALLLHPEASGYEISKHSGVPRSKIYETLDSLVRKGAILEQAGQRSRVFRPVPYQTLFDRHRRFTENVLHRLENELAAYSDKDQTYNFFTLHGAEAVMARCRQTIARARRFAYLSCWPGELEQLRPVIEERNGEIPIFVLVYQNAEHGVGAPEESTYVFYHSVSGLQHIQVRELGMWLLLSADNLYATIVRLGEDSTTALCSNDPLLGMMVSQWVAHDIRILEVERKLGSAQHLFSAVERDRLQQVQRLAGTPFSRLEEDRQGDGGEK